MPTLKHLTCHVEWASSQVPLSEFQTAYADGYVETYIAVPSFPTPFEVHLTSDGYIAPGLAMFVFMDGVYQCNRNRQNLQIPGEDVPKNLTEINFQVNQKERQIEDGSFHGKDWRFEKVNIVESSDIDTEHRAPYDGEYIGILEVVVLRCFPDENATPPGTPRSSIDVKSIKNSDEESKTDGLFSEKLIEGVADTADITPATDPIPSPPSPPTPKRVHKAKPKAEDSRTRGLVRIRGGNGGGRSETKLLPRGLYRIRHKDSHTSKTKPRRPMFGLDGAWDRDEDAKKTSLTAQASAKCTASKTSKENKTSDTWNYPATTAWGHPISPNMEPTKDQAGASSDNKATSSGEVKKSRTELIRTTTGKWHPVRIPANSSKPIVKRKSRKDRSDPRANFSKDWGTSPTLASPGRDRSRKPRSPIGHREESPLLNLRGGGPGSYSVSSVNGAATPSVVININNNGGPPPPRNWQAEEVEEGKNAKASWRKTPPANNLAITAPPAHDTDIQKKTKKELKKEKKQKRKRMPGAWVDPNEQDQDGNGGDNDNNNWDNAVNDDNKNDGNENWGNANWNADNDDNKNGGNNKWDNYNWNTTGNDDDQKNNNDWIINGADTSWDTSKDDVQNNDGGWGNNDNNDDQQDNGWDNNDSNDSGSDNEQETSSCGNTNEDDNNWNTNKKDKSNVTVGAKDPATLKPGKNNSKASGPTPGSAKNKASKKEKQKVSDVGDQGKEKLEKASSSKVESKRTPSPKAATPKSILKSSPKLPSAPGAWSPPLPPSRSNSKSPKAIAPPSTKSRTPKYALPRPILSISTSPPQPQPYWATWADLSPTEEKVQSVTTAANEIIDSILSEPIYSIPASVARRSSMSHQVRPGRSTTYRHKRGVPKYMDDFSKPYAVFRFHYRDREYVECLTGTTIVEPEIDEKQRMASLTKEEIIEEFMKVRRMMRSEGGKESGGESESGSGKRTWKSNPGNEVVGPDLEKLDERLRRLETSAEHDDEVVAGWLEGTGGGDEEWAEKDSEGEGTWANNRDNADPKSEGKGKGKGKEKAAENDNAGGTAGNDNDNNGWKIEGKGKKKGKKAKDNANANANANATTNANNSTIGVGKVGAKSNDKNTNAPKETKSKGKANESND
ncbi:hypothetical protein N7G274_009644 [Stereocaulon virgatum]|uniref:Uncharacterized protein n=1 Tax=Stereocaulon virgatum TaxID=373712 RepID=A0ABR3ZYU1_9LECA